jgi:tripartite-type tricarboxylate transporter receptor subunit TctC
MSHLRKLCNFMGFALATMAALTCLAQDVSYPNKAIRLVVPVPAGGAADGMARLVAEHLQAKWGQPVVVENKPGAGSSLGMALVAKAPADGYTLGLGNIAANAINPALQPTQFHYHPIKDFSAISMVGVTPLVLVVNADKLPVKNVNEFVAYLKSHPNLAYGSSGVGSSLHLAMELFLQKTGTKMLHVPYKGSAPMVTDLLSGQVVAAIDAAATSMPHVLSGKLRALAVTASEKVFFAPDLPLMRDMVPGFEMRPWHGMVAPSGTPNVILNKVSLEVNAFLRTPTAQARLQERGIVPMGNTPAEFQALMASEFETYRKVIQDAGIKAE